MLAWRYATIPYNPLLVLRTPFKTSASWTIPDTKPGSVAQTLLYDTATLTPVPLNFHDIVKRVAIFRRAPRQQRAIDNSSFARGNGSVYRVVP